MAIANLHGGELPTRAIWLHSSCSIWVYGTGMCVPLSVTTLQTIAGRDAPFHRVDICWEHEDRRCILVGAVLHHSDWLVTVPRQLVWSARARAEHRCGSRYCIHVADHYTDGLCRCAICPLCRTSFLQEIERSWPVVLVWKYSVNERHASCMCAARSVDS
jgi:hypothetical protein